MDLGWSGGNPLTRLMFAGQTNSKSKPKLKPAPLVSVAKPKPSKKQPLKPLSHALRRLFKAVPKTELHMHLPGSTPIGLIKDFLEEKGWAPKKIDRETRLKNTYQSLNDFLKTYYRVTGHLKSPEQFKRATLALLKECAKENVRYMEVRASILHKGDTPEKIVQAIEAGLKEGMAWVKETKGWEMKTGLIILAQRAGSVEDSMESARLAVALSKKRGSLVRGFDLAGSETDHAPQKHAKALRYVQKYNLPLTVHAGETASSGAMSGTDSVRQAVKLGADRIGHGLQMRHDPKLMKLIKERQLPVEICPWVNVQLKSVDGYGDHPLPDFLEEGLNVSLSTDNRMLSKITLTEQLGHLYQHGLLTRWDQLKTLILNGVQGAFSPAMEKKRLFRQVTQEFQRLEQHPKFAPLIQRYLSNVPKLQTPASQNAS